MRRCLPAWLLFAVGWLLAGCADGGTATPTRAANRAAEFGPLGTEVATPTLAPAAATRSAASPTPAPEATATPRPTATPQPTARVTLGRLALHNGDYVIAADHLNAALAALPVDADRLSLQLDLLRAYSAAGSHTAVLQLAQGMLRQPDAPPEIYFFAAEAHVASGDCAAAIAAYTQYLAAEARLAGLLNSRSARCALTLGDVPAAIAAYEQAIAADAHFLDTYQYRLALAQIYLNAGDLAAAADVYQTIADNARTPFTQAEMGFLAAQTRLNAGERSAAIAGYRRVMDGYPTQPSAHLALAELIRLEQPVDQYERGVINYHAGVFAPCVEAFERYLSALPRGGTPRAEALRYLAACHEGLGDVAAAQAVLTRYAALGADEALAARLESAQIYRRAGATDTAIEQFTALVAAAPTSDTAAEARWWLARLADWQGESAQAVDHYTQLAQAFPADERAAEALFRAGWLAQIAGQPVTALELWKQAATDYPARYHGQAALTWALQIAADDADLQALAAAAAPGFTYYSVRNRDLAADITPFAAGALPLRPLTTADQAATEAYLRAALALPDSAALAELPPFVQEDGHLQRGTVLWGLREFEAAKREFELVREAYNDNALVSYQLALYFRDIGLYRSSILAAERAIVLLGETPFSAPRFLAALAYPRYYADLVEPLAAEYGYDPLLQFALVRQESLYESFATSSAVAQGLAQVIPDTGVYIAGKLAWPNYQNSDLYRPSVGLRFGGFYLAEQLALFGGETYAALAAYNGGPGNALVWFQRAGAEIDRYVETVTFPETRSYIERIYVGHAVYRHLYAADQP